MSDILTEIQLRQLLRTLREWTNHPGTTKDAVKIAFLGGMAVGLAQPMNVTAEILVPDAARLAAHFDRWARGVANTTDAQAAEVFVMVSMRDAFRWLQARILNPENANALTFAFNAGLAIGLNDRHVERRDDEKTYAAWVKALPLVTADGLMGHAHRGGIVIPGRN